MNLLILTIFSEFFYDFSGIFRDKIRKKGGLLSAGPAQS